MSEGVLSKSRTTFKYTNRSDLQPHASVTQRSRLQLAWVEERVWEETGPRWDALFYSWVRPFSAPPPEKPSTLRCLLNSGYDYEKASRHRIHGGWTLPRARRTGTLQKYAPFVSLWMYDPCLLREEDETEFQNRASEQTKMEAEDAEKRVGMDLGVPGFDSDATSLNFLRGP